MWRNQNSYALRSQCSLHSACMYTPGTLQVQYSSGRAMTKAGGLTSTSICIFLKDGLISLLSLYNQQKIQFFSNMAQIGPFGSTLGVIWAFLTLLRSCWQPSLIWEVIKCKIDCWKSWLLISWWFWYGVFLCSRRAWVHDSVWSVKHLLSEQ